MRDKSRQLAEVLVLQARALAAPMAGRRYKCGDIESNLWPYRACGVRVVRDPMYDNGLAGRARARAARALHLCRARVQHIALELLRVWSWSTFLTA